MSVSHWGTEMMLREQFESPVGGLDLFDSLGLCEALMSKESIKDAPMASSRQTEEKAREDEHLEID